MTYLKEEELPKIETKLEIKNEDNDGPVKLYLYGLIRRANAWDDPEDGTFISSKMVRDKLEELDGQDIDIHINTRGGDAFESIAIRNLLKQHNGRVHIYIDSLAASGGSIISTAGEKAFMFESSMQMIHKAWTIALGNADDLIEAAERLEKLDSSLKKAYMSKFVGTEDELEQLLADETWLTAEEAIAFGLADEIIKDEDLEDDEDDEGEEQNNVKENLFNKYKRNIKTKKQEEGKPDSESGLFNAFKKSTGGKE
ncbi:MAG: Clp protease [Candidatus Frackibacter sp. T328-2]|nr:MAG: Clp protease [Candidatus Frackibacter sp. T328-2]